MAIRGRESPQQDCARSSASLSRIAGRQARRNPPASDLQLGDGPMANGSERCCLALIPLRLRVDLQPQSSGSSAAVVVGKSSPTMYPQPPPHVLLGKAVYQIRKKKGLSKKSVADEGGFSTRWLADLESGRTNPTYDNLRRLALAMTISLRELMRVVEEVENHGRPEPK